MRSDVDGRLAVSIAVVTTRVLGFCLSVLIRAGINLAGFVAGASLPIGMMFACRSGWFH